MKLHPEGPFPPDSRTFICAACGYRCYRRKATKRFLGQPKKYPVGGETVDVCLDCFNDMTKPLSGVDMWADT